MQAWLVVVRRQRHEACELQSNQPFATLVQAGACAGKAVTQVVTGLVDQLALHFFQPSEDAGGYGGPPAELTFEPAQLITFLVRAAVRVKSMILGGAALMSCSSAAQHAVVVLTLISVSA